MSNKWVIIFGVSCTFILLFALLFRWEEGPKQKEEGILIIHKTDRWTYQAWIEVYGSAGEEILSGKEIPIIPSERVEEVLEESFTLNSQKEFNKQDNTVGLSQQTLKIELEQNDLETKIEQQEMSIKQMDEVKNSNIEGYNLYVSKRFEVAKRLRKEKNKYYTSLWRLSHCSGVSKDLDEIVEQDLSQVHIHQFKKYCGAVNNIEEGEEKIRLIELRITENDNEAKRYVKKQLINNAWKQRSILTKVWFGLLGIVFLGTIIGLIQIRIRSKNKP